MRQVVVFRGVLWVPRGRKGHARVAILTVITEEMDEAIHVLGATEEVGITGYFTSKEALAEGIGCLPFVICRMSDRSNGPASESARTLMEDWRPETILLVGIAGGIRRLSTASVPQMLDDGPELGDVVLATMVHFGDYGKALPGGFIPRWLPLVHPPKRLLSTHGEGMRLKQEWSNGILHWPKVEPPKLHMGEIVAVEAVAGNPYSSRQRQLINYFDKAIAIDMESKGVAEALADYDVGVHYHPRWMCIRGISDLVVGSGPAAKLIGGSNAEQRDFWRRAAARSAAMAARYLLIRLLSKETISHPAQPRRPAWPYANQIGMSDLDATVGT